MVQITGKIEIPQKISDICFKENQGIKDFEDLIEKNLSGDVSDLVSVILMGAISLSSSDIHLEPEEKMIKIRIRIDGLLHDVISFPQNTYQSIISRIKLLAGLKLNIKDKPQDGSFSVFFSLPQVKNIKEVEIRTSALPADYGETIVMRILNPESLKSIEELGLREDLLLMFKKEIQKPDGMIIVTGPTGSGKTTTLYAFLKFIHQPEIKIITIEDPIEYRLEGVSQTEVHPERGYNFPTGLRAIVRQDPDVILVGEIRDLETADIAIQAALTGHLVFSTLHTNDAAGTIPRLISLGVNPANIAPAINMAVAQRLIRKACKHCSFWRSPNEEEIKKIKNAISDITDRFQVDLKSPELKIVDPKGCKFCNFSGYKGRIGIFEAILIDDEITNLILKNPSIPEIKKIAIKKGMISMYQDGFLKIVQGMTTIEEVERMASE